MKRSEINRAISEAIELFDQYKLRLPSWAYWTNSDWQQVGLEAEEIRRHKLGWFATDFGSEKFREVGLLIFVVRNGCLHDQKPLTTKTYAEKFMVVRSGQVTPYHFHWCKTEDLINRSGGRLVVELAWPNDDECSLSDRPVVVQVDGLTKTVNAGDKLVLQPGESVTFPPKLCHQFYGFQDDATVLAGEVSSLNDDGTDNCFLKKPFERSPIVEDEPRNYLLCDEYKSNAVA
jgi:D-lyxose ketol-isomerase